MNTNTLTEAAKIIQTHADALRDSHTIGRPDCYDWMNDNAAYAEHQNMLSVVAELKQMEHEYRERKAAPTK